METDSNTTTPHGESWMGYSQIIKCRCGCPLHVTSATGFCSDLCEREAAEEASETEMTRERAIYLLTHDESGGYTGGLSVPCSRWGTTSAQCAEVAYELDLVVSGETGRGPDADTLEYAMGMVVNDSDDVAYTLREHGSDALRSRWADELGITDGYLAHARHLGADAAMAAASWLTMDEADARSILTDVDPEVMDRYAEPDLRAWEEACDEKLGDQVTGHGGWIYDTYVGDDLAVAWEEGRDEVWSDALQAHAIRVLGDTQGACELERDLENRVDALRIKAAHA